MSRIVRQRLDFISQRLKEILPDSLALIISTFIPHLSISDFALQFPEDQNRFIKFLIVYQVKEIWKNKKLKTLSFDILVRLKSEILMSDYLPWEKRRELFRLKVVGEIGESFTDFLSYEGYITDPKVLVLRDIPMEYNKKCGTCRDYPMRGAQFCHRCLPKENWQLHIPIGGMGKRIEKDRVFCANKKVADRLTVSWRLRGSRDIWQCILTLSEVSFYYENKD